MTSPVIDSGTITSTIMIGSSSAMPAAAAASFRARAPAIWNAMSEESTGAGKQRIRAQVPQAEMTRYAIDLRSMTGGRGLFTMRFDHYEEVPPHLAEKVIADSKKEREHG